MIEAFAGIFTAFGLSVSAGLNAYLPLLVVALLARFTHLITLGSPYNHLTNGWVILVLSILLVIEVFADRIAGVDTANDILQTFAPAKDAGAAAQAVAQVMRGCAVGDNYCARAEAVDLLAKQRHVPVTGQIGDMKALGEARHNLERASPDGPR